jgi:formate dehydrogenase maturation protein FdhE
MPRPRVQQAPNYPSSHGHLLQFSVQKKFKLQREKKKKFTEPPFLPQNSEHVYQQRCDYKKKRRKAQQHKLAKNPTFVSCVAKAKKNIYSKRRKEREKKSKGRLPVNG